MKMRPSLLVQYVAVIVLVVTPAIAVLFTETPWWEIGAIELIVVAIILIASFISGFFEPRE